MKTVKNRKYFLVLVPHKDTRGILQKIEGICGSFPFPCVAPLASLSKPLDSDELKHIARLLREITNGEKFNTVDYSCTTFPSNLDNMELFGPKIDLSLSPSIFETITKKIKTIFYPILIGTCLIQKDNEAQVRCSCGLCGSWLNSSSFSKLSFRAAAVANMYWQPCIINNEKVFKWKIDKLFWLPKTNK